MYYFYISDVIDVMNHGRAKIKYFYLLKIYNKYIIAMDLFFLNIMFSIFFHKIMVSIKLNLQIFFSEITIVGK